MTVFISVTLDGISLFSQCLQNLRKTCEHLYYSDSGISLFSPIKILGKHVNTYITVRVLGRVSFHVMPENWKQLKDTPAFSSFLVC